MKNFKLLALTFAAACLCAAPLAAQQARPETPDQLKARFRSAVKKSANGDIAIGALPEYKKLESSLHSTPLVHRFLLYIDPAPNYTLLRMQVEAAYKKGVSNERFLEGFAEYLREVRKVRLKKIPAAMDAVRKCVESGSPVFSFMYLDKSGAVEKALLERARKRAEAENINAWRQELSKLPRLSAPADYAFRNAVIMGFNPRTGEYLVLISNFDNDAIWMTTQEFESLRLKNRPLFAVEL